MARLFNLRPHKTKLNFVWDEDTLFRYYEQQGDSNSLSDKLLMQKLLILLLLLGAHRISTVKLFSVSNMVLNDLPSHFYNYRSIKAP